MAKLIVCIIAGLGAGVGTGLAGLSAAAVISPMLITFLDFPAYEAVGISLASDVLALMINSRSMLPVYRLGSLTIASAFW